MEVENDAEYVDMENGDQESEVKDDKTSDQNEDKTEKLIKLPLARIRHIMKMDPEVHIASQEAVFLITKATELFIQSFAKESYVFTAHAKKKTVQKRDVDQAMELRDCFAFLDGAMEL